MLALALARADPEDEADHDRDRERDEAGEPREGHRLREAAGTAGAARPGAAA